MLIPKQFFVVKGRAVSSISELNAFDLALKKAGIAQCNIILVSSIIPPNCKEIKMTKTTPGTITPMVLAKNVVRGEATINAGIAWAKERKDRFGIIAEAHGFGDKENLVKTLKIRINEMAKIRKIVIKNIEYQVDVLKVSEDSYGCVVAALVFVL
jgi:arginine decarboxylase